MVGVKILADPHIVEKSGQRRRLARLLDMQKVIGSPANSMKYWAGSRPVQSTDGGKLLYRPPSVEFCFYDLTEVVKS